MHENTVQSEPSLRNLALQPSTRGATIGGLLGTVVGALIGALTDGLFGTLRGGLIGLIGGIVIGDVCTTRRRRLTPAEIKYADDVFAGSLRYTPIYIARDSMFSSGAPITLGNTVCLKTEWGHFVDDTMELTESGRRLLIHELVHVWQYQTAGPAYFAKSLWAQLQAWRREGSRLGAYRWHDAHSAARRWHTWNPEQQASVIELFNVLLRRVNDDTASAGDETLLAQLRPYAERVRWGQGAPHWDVDRLLARVWRAWSSRHTA